MNNNYTRVIDKMQKALEFYADKYNWEDTNEIYTGEDVVTCSNISIDSGQVAQNTLDLLKEFKGD